MLGGRETVKLPIIVQRGAVGELGIVLAGVGASIFHLDCPANCCSSFSILSSSFID